ncbi:response regulator transcription factor [Clostridium tagluense]|uniref:response regulator n=1 Tax=Clostridium tagluense TaxID=360422 RepID=UPI001CF1FAA5|nr:response regulator transcription factor [Clostridium tagluense]MCB2311098.1 response regulator transcription factor [Clostridium tagluense]MCB2318375.1 response regulator transcription factor [Clostridium tagluense]MCB2323151.1 response regulator transcription factor [Clostridium tagluense]MCB2325576.1 response regulator transcription factor [Clostridium tagluense]MCB2332878.1 response regulator transcription factor [Clostridium tagluense]
MAIKVLIADDDILIREGLKIILGLDGEFEVVGCVSNGLEALEMCIEKTVDVALLDVRMPVMNGVQAVREIAMKTTTKTLILTTFDEDEYIFEALKNGARGYLLKNNSPDKIKDAIKTVFGGNIVMQDVILDKVTQGFKTSRQDKVPKGDTFTEREIDVIKAISEGLSNKEISNKLYISEGTVKNYITSILNKTGLKHRTQIAIYYLQGEI